MTVAKREKKQRGRPPKSPPPLPNNPHLEEKMVVNYPRICRYCNRPTYSAVCECGRVTDVHIVTKGG